MRLRDLYTGDLTWRELSTYVRGLGPQSRLRTALNAGRVEPTGEQVLLADLFDMTQHVDWHIQAANATKKSELPPQAKPYPRWWETDKRRRQHSPQRRARLEDARRRSQERQRAIAEGRLT
ncbi:hypothetical protein [Streptomyces xanthochromogenes]|uniref:hypothetical protein n=1 Tax=Streptomyces xanthochromogenes TaxID=67384 RepID=UPI002F419F12